MPRDPRMRAFVPRWTRAASIAIGLLLVLGAAFVLWRTSSTLRDLGFAGVSSGNVVLVAVFVIVGAVLLWRLGGVRADPSEEGLRVRNVLRVRHVVWAQVVGVRFTPSLPWVMLDLADGTQLAVMGVQQSDGRRGRAEADRLRALVDELGTARDPQAGKPPQ